MFGNKFKFLILVLLFIFNMIVYAVGEGNIDPNYKYAWGDQLGWLNFGCDNCHIKITDNGLTGYVWSENFGWINLSPENGGVKNDGQGNLSGYAWGENIGWLDFSGVKINNLGKFQGKIKTENYGIINFDCSYCEVKTNWSASQTKQDGGTINKAVNQIVAFVTGGLSSPVPSQKNFFIVINNNEPYTFNKIVELTIEGGDFNTYYMAISNFPDFKNASKEPYKKKKTWDLCQDRDKCSTGKYTVYAKFFVYGAKDFPVTSTVGASPVVSDDIFYLEKNEPTLLPTLIDRTSSILKKTFTVTKKLVPSIKKETKIKKITAVSAKKTPSIFERNWRLLTYTKTEGNLVDFVAPGLAKEIERLAAGSSFQPSANLGPILALANVLGFFLLPFKNLLNLSISLFILLIIFSAYRYLRFKRIKKRSQGSLIIENSK